MNAGEKGEKIMKDEGNGGRIGRGGEWRVRERGEWGWNAG